MADAVAEPWPAITAYVLVGTGRRGARIELEPFVGAKVVELPVPLDAGLLWGMWNTVTRASNTWDETFINAVIVQDAGRGESVVQLEPTDGSQPLLLRLPVDSIAFGKIHGALIDAMRISAGHDQTTSAARILRKRAMQTAKRKEKTPARRTTPTSAIPSPARNLNAEYEQAKTLLRRLEGELQQAKSGGSRQQVDDCRKKVAEVHRELAATKAALKQVKVATQRLNQQPKPNKTSDAQRLTAKKSRKKQIRAGKVLRAAREVRLAPQLEADAGIRFSEDPDAGSKTVWAFKSGRSYHRRDCHLVEAREGAVRIPVETARQRNLERCMHCAPTVR